MIALIIFIVGFAAFLLLLSWKSSPSKWEIHEDNNGKIYVEYGGRYLRRMHDYYKLDSWGFQDYFNSVEHAEKAIQSYKNQNTTKVLKSL